jgi:UDP-glucose 4-epimerase
VQVAVGTLPVLGIFGEDYPTPDGTCVRDYIHVNDLVDAHILALARLERDGGNFTMNCGHGTGASIWEVVRSVERATGETLPVKSAPRRPGDPPVLIAAADRIRAELGWSPRWDLDAMVAHALAWERKLAAAPEGVHPGRP